MIKNNILLVNFNKPWWRVIFKFKLLSVLVLMCEVISSSFNALIPLVLGYIFKVSRFDYFILFCGLWAVERVIEYARSYLSALVQLRIVYSVHYSAHRFFLEIDPIYHAQRESGAILGKINRAARGYEDILDVTFLDFLPMAISITTVIVMLFYQAPWLGFGALFFLLFMALITIVFIKNVVIAREKAWIKADDAIKSVSTENLAQVYLIRACFASNQIDAKLRERNIAAQKREKELILAYRILNTFNKVIYLIPFTILGLYLLNEIAKGSMDNVIAISFLTTYLRGTRDILRLEQPIMRVTKSLTRITDLYDFIRRFGKQTYPVLERAGSIPPEHCTTADTIEVSVQNLFFDYHKDAKIFDDNSLYLNVPCQQDIKLYGIIGPSGVGKSTFISILGGQIRPTSGTVTIDGVNIYTVDDHVRKRLIAMQGQVPTSMRGSVKYNLLFGLPEREHGYSDTYLMDILQRVGLWPLFESKDGLDTFIGEGGLNLSGGQRQRLNFASLYLRANFYHPHLILIDEPTSSLDEVSEQAITHMILELARSAITMVIAHRIKTVENAVGILDFSVLTFEKELKFYNHKELLRLSPYYRKLVRGKVTIEHG